MDKTKEIVSNAFQGEMRVGRDGGEGGVKDSWEDGEIGVNEWYSTCNLI